MGLLSLANTGTGLSRGLLGGLRVAQHADPVDEWFLRRQAERAGQAAPMAAPPPAAPPTPPAEPHRARVSGWRLLDRVLGGQTVSEGLDAERARLEAEAQRPQRLAQQQAALSAIQDPRERALFLGMGGEDWQKNVGQQFAPQVISAGGRQSVIGTGASVTAPSFSTVNDTIFRNDPGTGQSSPAATAPAAYSDVTARYNAEHPVLSQDQVRVGPDGQPVAYGVQRPDVVNLAPGGEALAFGPDGQITNRVGSTQPRDPVSPQDAAKARGGVQYIQTQAQTVQAAVARARDLARTPGAVGFFGGLPAIPGTPGADLEAQLATIKSNLTQQALAQMRANSPTGGALGSVSDRENEMLASGVASLNRAQSPAQFNQALDQIDRAMTNLSRISQDNYQATYGSDSAAAPAGQRLSPEQASQLPSGTRFVGLDGVERVKR